MSIPTQSQISNPVTGVFGTGQMQIFGAGGTGVWLVPAGIDKVRVRMWGAGGSSAAGTSSAGGGGFALKVIYGLSSVTSVPVIVGTVAPNSSGGTSSFGSYVSATGGSLYSSLYGVGGIGINGDINYQGGSGYTTGGGVASLFGNGGGWNASQTFPMPGASGYGVGINNGTAGSGLLGTGGGGYTTSGSSVPAGTGFNGQFSIDFIGTGGGGGYAGPGANGGGGSAAGGGVYQGGGYPGGGGGGNGAMGAPGMVIVEW
jgi:hypothetical protein